MGARRSGHVWWFGRWIPDRLVSPSGSNQRVIWRSGVCPDVRFGIVTGLEMSKSLSFQMSHFENRIFPPASVFIMLINNFSILVKASAFYVFPIFTLCLFSVAKPWQVLSLLPNMFFHTLPLNFFSPWGQNPSHFSKPSSQSASDEKLCPKLPSSGLSWLSVVLVGLLTPLLSQPVL